MLGAFPVLPPQWVCVTGCFPVVAVVPMVMWPHSKSWGQGHGSGSPAGFLMGAVMLWV